MLLLALGVGLGLVLTTVVVVKIGYGSGVHTPDLGFMSNQWIAAYNASRQSSST
jgi:hypothetical protein